jgi:beta-aspartyl-peptidase (threonine type)
LLLVGGVGFYFVVQRQQQIAAVAVERARHAAALARAEAARRQETEVRPAASSAEQSQESRINAGDAGKAVRAAVEAVMRASEEGWNRGDVEAFVEHYWKSDDVTFSGGGKTTRGWEATAQRYREKYPTREKMGRLSFSNLEITPLGDEAALVLGEWKLEREEEPVSGNFSLVFRKIDGRWVIVHDHTSRASQ